jgi:histidinol dehydrogenase
MKIIRNPDRTQWPGLCQRPQLELEFLESAVRNVLNRVRTSGDDAIRELTLEFDKVSVEGPVATQEEIAEAASKLSPSLKAAIITASKNIETFHAAQRRPTEKIETMPGVTCWRKAAPIQKVGIYIPGGTAPLFSTVLMLGIPARIAGCDEIILCTPPDQQGKIHQAILFTANYIGIRRIFKVGGAQAIAAMAYGTKTIPAVHKIFGPGNQYVTKAKQLVSQEGVAIDMPAGPSEVLVIADRHADASYIAADLLSQAEHGPDSQVVLVTMDEQVMDSVLKEIEQQLKALPRKEMANAALINSLAVIFDSVGPLIDFVNEYAPEHLIIHTKDCDVLVDKVVNAGSVFLGAYTPEAAGDYASGTNHTLPTNGFAKTFGGVSLESFMKYITVQKITRSGLDVLGPVVEEMAEAEELKGHAEAIRIRRK